jgi:hypothetical protein
MCQLNHKRITYLMTKMMMAKERPKSNVESKNKKTKKILEI